MKLVHVKQHHRVHVPEMLHDHFHGLENFFYCLVCCSGTDMAFFLHPLGLKSHNTLYQLILVLKMLVKGFFGHAELPRHIIHGHTFDSKPQKNGSCFF